MNNFLAPIPEWLRFIVIAICVLMITAIAPEMQLYWPNVRHSKSVTIVAITLSAVGLWVATRRTSP